MTNNHGKLGGIAPNYLSNKKIFKIILFSFALLTSLVSFMGISSAVYSWNFNSQNKYFDCTNNNFCTSLDHRSMQTDKNYLALSLDQQTFNYLWIANSNENTLSKIDTITNKEVGRYFTCDWGGGLCQPSRTAVDSEGNAWVGNREGSMDVIKIAGLVDTTNCNDDNRNGIIDTSRDSDGDGKIGALEILPWGQDECVMIVVNHWGDQNTITGIGVRGMTIDTNGYLWVGIFATRTYYKIDSGGKLINKLITEGGSYGMIDGINNIIWTNEPSQKDLVLGGLVKINTLDNSYVRYDENDFGCTNHLVNCFYVITADTNGNVFLTNWQKGILQKFNSNDNSITDYPVTSGAGMFNSLRGLALDKEGNAWTSTWKSGIISKIDLTTKQEICTSSGLMDLSGIAVDGKGNVWGIGTGTSKGIINNINDQVYKLDSNCNFITAVPVGKGPYSYSDTTGNLVTQFVKTGFWEVTLGSQEGTFNWKDIRWKENNIQPGDSIEVNWFFLDANNNIISQSNNLPHHTPTKIEKDYVFDLGGFLAPKLQIRITMNKVSASSSPQLSNLEITTNQINSNLKCADIPYVDCNQAATTNNPFVLSQFPECANNPICNTCYCQWEGSPTSGVCKPVRESINTGSPSCGGVVNCIANPQLPGCSSINCQTQPQLPECMNCVTQCIINDIKTIDNCKNLNTITEEISRHVVVNNPQCPISDSTIATCSNYQKTYNCALLNFFNFKSFIMALAIVLIIYFFMHKKSKHLLKSRER